MRIRTLEEEEEEHEQEEQEVEEEKQEVTRGPASDQPVVSKDTALLPSSVSLPLVFSSSSRSFILLSLDPPSLTKASHLQLQLQQNSARTSDSGDQNQQDHRQSPRP